MRRICSRLRSSMCSPSEKAFAHVKNVVWLHEVVQIRTLGLDYAAGVASVQNQPTFGAAGARAAGCSEALTNRHAAFDALRSGLADFTVDVEHRGTVHVNDVAVGHHDIVLAPVKEKDAGDVDFLAKRLAVSNTGENDRIRTVCRYTPGQGEHVRYAHVHGLQLEAAGLAHLPQ